MKNKIEQLTFTRFIAAISIVIFHYGTQTFPFNDSRISFLFENANIAVNYFFVLSGFVMVIAYGDKTGKNVRYSTYIKNRIARIYPLYFFALISSVVFSLTSEINYQDLFLNLTMIQAWIPGKALTVNYPGWSLSAEVFFYAVFPFLFNKIYKKLSLKCIVGYILTFWILNQVLVHAVTGFQGSYLMYHPLLHLNSFLIGNISGLFFINHKIPSIAKTNYLFCFLAGVLLVVLKYPFNLNFHNGLLAILFAGLIVVIVSRKGVISALLSKKIFVFLGEISFGIYILQYPVWLLITDDRLENYLNIPQHWPGNFYIKLFGLLFFSVTSYLFLEKPLRKKIRKLDFAGLPSLYSARTALGYFKRNRQ